MPDLTGNEKRYLDHCIDSTYVSSVGSYVNQFEEMVAKATGSNYAIATSSGTTGLHAALTAVGVKHGDLVILPAFTFIASANAVAHCGAAPWLMDISRGDWCLDPEFVRSEIETHCEKRSDGLYYKAARQRVAALMPVYTLGNIPDMEAFRAIADEYELPLIADAACAVGAKYKGTDFAPFADLSVLSFNGNKTVTCGGGGAVISGGRHSAQEWAERVRHLTTTARVWPDYDFDMVGFNYRMTNIQAAVGCAQMERLEKFIGRKKYVREYYKNVLQSLTEKGIDFFPATDGSSCWFSGTVLPEGTKISTVKELCARLKEQDIEARPFWKPVHLQEPYKACPRSDTTVSDSLWQRIVTLPCSSNITEEELDHVAGAVLMLFKNHYP